MIDLTRPIESGMSVWPGDPPVMIERQPGFPFVSRLCLSSHAGTHLDAPAHFIPDGADVAELSLDLLNGPAWVAPIEGPGRITAADLAAAGIPPGTARLVLRTANSQEAGFDPSFVALAPSAAEWLLEAGVRLLVVDGPSVDAFDSVDYPVHRMLLGAGMPLVEGAVVQAAAGAYDLLCMPLPIRGGDGAPVRAALRPRAS